MRRDAVTAIRAVLVFTVLLGLVYPLLTTAVGQLTMPGRAGGSLVSRGGRVVGSRLIGQDFANRAGYFQTRPSVTSDDPAATAFNNRGPNQASLAVQQHRYALDYAAREHVALAAVPADAATTSASGVDPQISPRNARIQATRVANARGLGRDRVLALVDEHTDGRGLGFAGEPGVDVLALNLALDEQAGR
jgi:K+-transporting ATPase ATPase C chain